MTLTADFERVPTAFTYWEHRKHPRIARLESTARKLFNISIFPTDKIAVEFCDSLFRGDAVAENFVDEVLAADPTAGRALLDRALVEGIDALDDVPASMQVLFDEFETLPDWVRPEVVEQGAAIWRRWGTMLFAVAGGITLEMYTEAAVATPLSLAGGYAGDNALRRFLETCQFWVDTSEPGALLRIGSTGRATAMKVRVMHVSVRRRIDGHPEWHTEQWGYPISQGYQMLTLLGGSTVPALALRLVGLQTTPDEIRALLHFQKYMGHLLGVDVSNFPTTIADSLRMTAMVSAARSYDAGIHGKELIESFPASFAPRPNQKGLARIRARYNHGIYAAYTTLFMSPGTRGKYDMPSAFPWILIVLARFPFITVLELIRRTVPGVGPRLERISDAHRRSWLRAQMDGREAEFEAKGGLRR
ncbi:oxygenase MpaB family protein [Rhodococcus sp. IEGM 1381]|uniref:oxygenase MpaB family protein n=1 Tax=Rhodococcus sp. IEGM 1381 TaxID=3047085 RepID=UPI0024B86D6A|nr:oxygenase MpaB family protein [Rhodococcus sp. IEGM 1381]MDI9896855.1 oxygenase MpaB family protein [Rhodococcus sp. IEGM 1381]